MDMRTKDPYPIDFRDLVNTKEGWVDRRIFWDQEIYDLEMKHIFARTWQFIAHDSQIPNKGDFVSTYMGEDRVIGARGEDGKVKVFTNSCPHRGNKICYADLGNTKQFTCNYHGWAFGTDGSLLAIHDEHVYDKGDINKSEWGLKSARVENYKGLNFANFDESAPGLEEWLGDYRWYLDMLLDNEDGGTEFLPGTIKSYANANWKFGLDNFVGDTLHGAWNHDSGARALTGQGLPVANQANSFHASVNGHGWNFGTDSEGDIGILGHPEIIEYYRGIRAKMAERLGPMRAKIFGSLASAAIFPNISFLPGLGTFRVWLPRGPRKLELRIWTTVNKNMPDEIKQAINIGNMLSFNPGGCLEMDDGENWEGNTITNSGYVTRQQKLHYRCGINHRIDHPELPGTVYAGMYSDANQRGFLQRWADVMTTENWADLPQRYAPRFAGKPTR